MKIHDFKVKFYESLKFYFTRVNRDIRDLPLTYILCSKS